MAKIYKALWVSEDSNGTPVQEFEHAIVATEYDFSYETSTTNKNGDAIAVPKSLDSQINKTNYRDKLPRLKPPAIRWRLHAAAEGVDETERVALGHEAPFSLSVRGSNPNIERTVEA